MAHQPEGLPGRRLQSRSSTARTSETPPFVCALAKRSTTLGAIGDRLERVGFPEEGTLLEEYNELGYDECKRLVALMAGVVDDECLELYEGGLWLKDIYWSRGAFENGKPPGFTCAEP